MMQKMRSMKFNQKISIVVALLMICSNIVVLLLTSASAIQSLQVKSGKLAQGQLTSVNLVMESIFNDINRLMNNSIADIGVQNYVTYDLQNDARSLQNINDAYTIVNRLKESNDMIDYVSLIHYERDLVLYVGEVWQNNDFRRLILADFEQAQEIETGNLRVGLMPKAFDSAEYVLNFYCPMNEKYDRRTNQEVAFLVVGIGEHHLRDYMAGSGEDFSLELCLTDQHGKILFDGVHEKINTEFTGFDRLDGKNGSYTSGDNMVMYQKFAAWDWYTVGTMPMEELLRDTRSTMYLLIIFIFSACAAAIAVCYYLSKSLYKPMDEIMEKMEEVSEGNLNTSMRTDFPGEDFKQLAEGFNSMTNHIQQLMEQVKNEQHELEQSKLNALQSQIKPHFLYNTLECIHWQALSEGNLGVSQMVKALANYYRLCLSKGQDIIPLSQELAHIRNYLLIQNMRYDDIAKADIIVDEYFDEVLIPKMTLQPLVENAIYHGLKSQEDVKGIITIDAKEGKDAVIISVSDTGTGMPKERIEEINRTLGEFSGESGYGVKNVHKRIAILFGAGYGLRYRTNESGGVTVEIRLPKFNGRSER